MTNLSSSLPHHNRAGRSLYTIIENADFSELSLSAFVGLLSQGAFHRSKSKLVFTPAMLSPSPCFLEF